MAYSPTSPIRVTSGKRKADEITGYEYEEGETVNFPEEPEPKKAKVDHTSTASRRWDIGMEMPQGRRRPHFIRNDSISGHCTLDDPEILWLGKAPLNAETKKANEDIARRAASRLGTVTHVYIICGAQSSKFVDRDGKRIHLWHPDSIRFHHQKTAADPHMFLAFGTKPDHIVLYGYVNVTVDEDGKPTDFATSRNSEYIVDGDDRIFELFSYEDEEHDCSSYCPRHKSGEEFIHTCVEARPRGCPLHSTENLLDHFCHVMTLKTEILGDHYCPCSHDKVGLLDHYCPCSHKGIQFPRKVKFTHHTRRPF
ncbi:uncharacterized protein F4807DRAFT_454468 [Annulohypoxylon truncatum]|uniref:uncharacterized protein n=1 Tax=Annulohypoxylon truncatum TaxID=327061 RepID=UPI002008C6FA|nr:uncharacterized protein F4807DRAFT_454468 [Annulohypoxylon truncatum]KAI1204763.1 hypothetical protein F4807DRAFT_454468 [Annulohypoxylon truncatum]